MITVSILINGHPIYTRSAVRIEDEDVMGKATYSVDDGSQIRHNPDEGAVKLAHKLLECIKEAGKENEEIMNNQKQR
jgi:hypothetical protein